MRKSMLLLALVGALSACGDGTNEASSDASEGAAAAVAEVDPNADAGFEAIAPGNYEIVHPDGRVDQLTVLPGMTWAMVYADGEAAGGTIFEQAGKKCFVTEGVDGHRCFSGTEPAGDGSIEVTGDDGETATVKPVSSFEPAPKT
jgi:hypothetical protein